MFDFNMKLADKTIGVHHFHYSTRAWCEDYLTDDPADFDITLTWDDIVEFGQTMRFENLADVAIESLLLHTQVTEWLFTQNAVVINGAALRFRDKAFLFCGATNHDRIAHLLLWKDRFGAEDVSVINSVHPLVRIPEEGEVRVYGTPWAGTERWQANISAPLAGVCFMQSGQSNSIRRLDPVEAMESLIAKMCMPRSGSALLPILGMADILLAQVPQYEFTCDISEEALQVAFEALTGTQLA